MHVTVYTHLTEFKVWTVSYGRSISPTIYVPSAKRAGHQSKGKKRGSATYSTDREDEVSKIFIISLLCVWRGSVHEWIIEKRLIKLTWISQENRNLNCKVIRTISSNILSTELSVSFPQSGVTALNILFIYSGFNSYRVTIINPVSAGAWWYVQVFRIIICFVSRP